METKLFVATKAFIYFNGKILLLRESDKYKDGSNHGKYDVVGGRIKPGQNFKESLLREIKEETGLNVKIGKPFFVNEWRPIVNNEQWHIVGVYFECVSNSNSIKLSEDHDHFLWINPNEYKNHKLIENLNVVFEEVLKNKM
ncbi:NUDIX domain-containing protein [Candidatus Woesearchaeota archaeon]|nr:NUDIX domain-containing protein [Candidatus Woesearchaeota archaeon]